MALTIQKQNIKQNRKSVKRKKIIQRRWKIYRSVFNIYEKGRNQHKKKLAEKLTDAPIRIITKTAQGGRGFFNRLFVNGGNAGNKTINSG